MAAREGKEIVFSEIKNKLRRSTLYQKEKLRKAKEKRERKRKRKREESQEEGEVSCKLSDFNCVRVNKLCYTCRHVFEFKTKVTGLVKVHTWLHRQFLDPETTRTARGYNRALKITVAHTLRLRKNQKKIYFTHNKENNINVLASRHLQIAWFTVGQVHGLWL